MGGGKLRRLNELDNEQQIAMRLLSRSNNATIALWGDSITKQNLIDGHYASRGYFTWLNILLGQPFTLLAVNGRSRGPWGATEGNSGLRSDQILPLYRTQVKAFNPDYALIMPGENDINQGRTAAQTFETIVKMYDLCAADGIKVIGSTITPSATGMDTDAKRAEYHKLNRMLKEYARRNPNIIMLDMGAAYIQPAAVKALDNHTVDQTHPSSLGAYKMGLIGAQTLKYHIYNQPTTLVYSNTDPDNLLGNGNFFGTDGQAPVVGTGATVTAGAQTPTGIIVGAYGNGSTLTVTKAAKQQFSGEDLVLGVTTAGTATNFQVYKEITTGFAVGDEAYAQIAIKFSDDAVIGKQIEFGVQERAGTSTIVGSDIGLFQESSSPDLSITPRGVYDGICVIKTPTFKVRETVNRLRTYFNPYMNAGSCRLIGWELRKALK